MDKCLRIWTFELSYALWVCYRWISNPCIWWSSKPAFPWMYHKSCSIPSWPSFFMTLTYSCLALSSLLIPQAIGLDRCCMTLGYIQNWSNETVLFFCNKIWPHLEPVILRRRASCHLSHSDCCLVHDSKESLSSAVSINFSKIFCSTATAGITKSWFGEAAASLSHSSLPLKSISETSSLLIQ